jgi:hypothetical protein
MARVMELDAAITQLGVGAYQYTLVFVMCLLIMAEAMEMNLLTCVQLSGTNDRSARQQRVCSPLFTHREPPRASRAPARDDLPFRPPPSPSLRVPRRRFLSPCVRVYWDLDSIDEADLSSVVFAASLIGTFVWGSTADARGRWTVAIFCALGNALFGLLTATSGRFYVLLLMRGVVGFSLGGVMQPYVMLQEYLPAQKRGAWSMCTSLSWVVGGMYVYGIAWAVLSSR